MRIRATKDIISKGIYKGEVFEVINPNSNDGYFLTKENFLLQGQDVEILNDYVEYEEQEDTLEEILEEILEVEVEVEVEEVEEEVEEEEVPVDYE